MHELVPLIHPANQYYVNRYLYMHVINHIEAILRFTKDVGADGRSPKLRELALSYADIQEATLMANLQEMSYIISSPADANLVAGGARVETVSPLQFQCGFTDWWNTVDISSSTFAAQSTS